jgi:hypothetical protein
LSQQEAQLVSPSVSDYGIKMVEALSLAKTVLKINANEAVGVGELKTTIEKYQKENGL